jgi:predicted phage-related endonuclease
MRQLSLTGFSAEEQQQLRRDISALEARAKQIDDEIRQETERIQQRFADPQPRVFPVAITYLVPAHLAR